MDIDALETSEARGSWRPSDRYADKPGASSPLLLLKLPAECASQRSNGESAVWTSGLFYTWSIHKFAVEHVARAHVHIPECFGPSWGHHPGPQLPPPATLAAETWPLSTLPCGGPRHWFNEPSPRVRNTCWSPQEKGRLMRVLCQEGTCLTMCHVPWTGVLPRGKEP